MSPPENGNAGAQTPASAQITVPTTKPKYNLQVALEVEVRIEAAASLAAYALLGEIDEDIVLAAVVVLLERAAQFLEITEREHELARAA